MTAEPSMEEPMLTRVRHEPALARYTLWHDGEHVGLADYEVTSRLVTITHTEVDPARRGQGLASAMVEDVLDDLRLRTDLRVVAQCPYVARWIDEHPEYQDLLSRGK